MIEKAEPREQTWIPTAPMEGLPVAVRGQLSILWCDADASGFVREGSLPAHAYDVSLVQQLIERGLVERVEGGLMVPGFAEAQVNAERAGDF